MDVYPSSYSVGTWKRSGVRGFPGAISPTDKWGGQRDGPLFLSSRPAPSPRPLGWVPQKLTGDRSWVPAVYLEVIPGNPWRTQGLRQRRKESPLGGVSERVTPEAAATHGSGMPLSNCADDTGEHTVPPPARGCISSLCCQEDCPGRKQRGSHRQAGLLLASWEERLFIVLHAKPHAAEILTRLFVLRGAVCDPTVVAPKIPGLGGTEIPSPLSPSSLSHLLGTPLGRESPALRPKSCGRRSSDLRTASSTHTGSGFCRVLSMKEPLLHLSLVLVGLPRYTESPISCLPWQPCGSLSTDFLPQAHLCCKHPSLRASLPLVLCLDGVKLPMSFFLLLEVCPWVSGLNP